MLVTRQQAREVSTLFRQHPAVLNVQVFGSVARYGAGNDLDIILVVDVDTAMEWVDLVEKKLRTESARRLQRTPSTYLSREIRRKVTEEILGNDFEDTLDEIDAAIYDADIDLFMFPSNWFAFLGTLQEALPHHDPHFMRKIARDAVYI